MMHVKDDLICVNTVKQVMMSCLSLSQVHLCCPGCWSPICVTGSKPSPRAYHTLTAVDEKRAILFGGFDGQKSLDDVWLFDNERKV